jgi:selenocysteine-specific elongation factor
LTAEDEAVKRQFEEAVRGAGFEATTLAEAAARSGIAEPRARKFYDLLAREGRLVRLGDLLFHSEVLDDLKGRLRARREADPVIDVAAFRELTGGLSRKYTIPLLEWLDRERVTRRVGDRREIL